MEKIRISRFLAESGIASRRKAEELVSGGRVKVNGETVRDLAFKVSSRDSVQYDGVLVVHEAKIVIALNKPAGYLSTVKDDFRRKTILDLVRKDISERVYPVGRLDYESRGLILLTNDGDIAYKITHPKFEIAKKYEVQLDRAVGNRDIGHIRKGIEIEGKELVPVDIKIQRENGNNLIEITIVEGRKRIIRKAFEKLGYQVKDLRRIQLGSLKLGSLKEGAYKVLKEDEIKKIFEK